jgi:hypothetical protein
VAGQLPLGAGQAVEPRTNLLFDRPRHCRHPATSTGNCTRIRKYCNRFPGAENFLTVPVRHLNVAKA